jgi:hypothetical protein
MGDVRGSWGLLPLPGRLMQVGLVVHTARREVAFEALRCDVGGDCALMVALAVPAFAAGQGKPEDVPRTEQGPANAIRTALLGTKRLRRGSRPSDAVLRDDRR